MIVRRARDCKSPSALKSATFAVLIPALYKVRSLYAGDIMKRFSIGPVLALAGIVSLSLVGAAQAQSTRIEAIQFVGGPAQVVQWAEAEAVAYGDDDTPLFAGSRDFVLAFAGNPDGTVHAWDTARQKVRVSGEGRDGVWLACQDLAPMSIACETSFRLSDDGELLVDSAVRVRPPTRGSVINEPSARGLPVCPRDPRCPKL